MKNLNIILLFLWVFFSSCIEKPIQKNIKDSSSTGIIIKDCSGFYLRIKDNDYSICNIELVKDFSDETVFVTYEFIEQCNLSDEIVCMMYHHNIGNINILTINK